MPYACTFTAAAPASQQSQAVPVYDQVATDSAHASPAPRTLKVQRRCRYTPMQHRASDAQHGKNDLGLAANYAVSGCTCSQQLCQMFMETLRKLPHDVSRLLLSHACFICPVHLLCTLSCMSSTTYECSIITHCNVLPVRFYSTGFCKWGNTCKFSHDRPHGPVTPEAPAASATGVTSRSVSGVVAQAANLGNTTGYTTSDARPLPNSSLTQSYGMHTLAANLQQEAFSPPFEFKTRYSMSSTMQPGVTASAVSPIVSPGTGSNIWSATDIANSSPFPGVGSGLPKKFAP